MASIFKYIGQAIAYTLFAVFVGYFATQPAYTHLDPEKAQIKLSFGHAGQHLTECRRLTQEELNRAKTVIGGRLATTGDLPEGRAGSLAEDVFLEERARSVAEITAGVNRVTLDQIPAYLEAFPPDPLTLVTLGPRSIEIPADR